MKDMIPDSQTLTTSGRSVRRWTCVGVALLGLLLSSQWCAGQDIQTLAVAPVGNLSTGGTYPLYGKFSFTGLPGQTWHYAWYGDGNLIFEDTYVPVYTPPYGYPSSATVEVTVEASGFVAPAGVHTLTFVVDNRNEIAETNEGNNSVQTIVNVGSGPLPARAQMTSPTDGSTLAGSSAAFAWTSGTGISQYRLLIGDYLWTTNIAALDMGTNRVCTVTNLPTDGRQLYVDLQSLMSGVWLSTNYTYTAASLAPGSLQVTLAPAGAISAGAMWQVDSGVWQYSGATVTNLSAGSHTVNFMGVTGWFAPTNQVVAISNGQAATLTASYGSKAQMLSPTPGTTVSSGSVTFNWNSGTSASQYALWVGSAMATYDLGAFATGTNQTQTVTLPVDGRPLYVRLWSMIFGNWQYNDYTYTAYTQVGGSAGFQSDSFTGATINLSKWTPFLMGNSVITQNNGLYYQNNGNGSTNDEANLHSQFSTSATNDWSAWFDARIPNLAQVNTNGQSVTLTLKVWNTINWSNRFDIETGISPTPLGKIRSVGADFTTNGWQSAIGSGSVFLDAISQPLISMGVSWQASTKTFSTFYAPSGGGSNWILLGSWNLGTNSPTAWNLDPAQGFSLYIGGRSKNVNLQTNDNVRITNFTATNSIITGRVPPTITTGSQLSQSNQWIGFPLPDATWNSAYNQTLQATNGVAPYTWSVAYCTLPAGLNLASNGTISGTPTVRGTSKFRVHVTGADGAFSDNDYSITVASGPMPVQMVSPAPGSTLASSTATFSWSSSTNITAYALSIGNAAGQSDIYGSWLSTNLSQTVTGLPTDGRPLYVTLWFQVNGAYEYFTYNYTAYSPAAATAATMTGPASGSTFGSSSVTFNWGSGVGVSQYALWVGSSSNGYDLGAFATGTNQTQTVTGLPTDGRALYVRLFSMIGGNWLYNDYSYRAYSGLGMVGVGAVLPPGAISGSYNQTLTASGGTLPYRWFWSGVTPPGLNLTTNGVLSGTPTAIGNYNFTIRVVDGSNTTNSQTESLTVQGRDLGYAAVMKFQHFWQTNAGSALQAPGWPPDAFTFGAVVKQAPTGTVNGATIQLPGGTTNYTLGTLPMTDPYSDLGYQSNFTSKVAMDAAFTNGLYTFTVGATHDGTNTLPVTMGPDNYPASAPHIANWAAAQAVNPASGFVVGWDPLPGGTTNDWVTMAVRKWVNGTADSNQVFGTAGWALPGALNGLSTSATIPGGVLTTNQVYEGEVNWYRFGSMNSTNYPGGLGASLYVTTTRFLINTIAPGGMLSPTNGSVMAAGPVTYTWSCGVGVSQYALWVGSSFGSYDLYAAGLGTNQSCTVTGLPADGRALYVRLWSLVGGTWQTSDYTYTASPAPTKAAMFSPVAGTTNNSSSVTYSWSSGVGVSQYALWVGSSSNSYDLGAFATGTNQTQTVTGLPTDGRALYVRLFSMIGGNWQYNDYSYMAPRTVKARFTSLSNGATLGSTNVTFTWDAGTGASQYALWVGTAPRGYDLYALGMSTNLAKTVTLPSNGGMVYVTLWSLINGTWKANSYEFTAYTAPSARAQMISPTNGMTFASTPVTFNWSGGTGVSQYALWVGSTAGSYDLCALDVGTNLTQQLSLPLDGSGIYVRLWSLIGGTWECNDYTYGTSVGGLGIKAKITSPTNGATLSAGATTFTWDAGTGVNQYALWVGSTPGSYDLYAAVEGGFSRALTLPADGGPIYVRVWSLMSGSWKFNDYFYSAYLAP